MSGVGHKWRWIGAVALMVAGCGGGDCENPNPNYDPTDPTSEACSDEELSCNPLIEDCSQFSSRENSSGTSYRRIPTKEDQDTQNACMDACDVLLNCETIVEVSFESCFEGCIGNGNGTVLECTQQFPESCSELDVCLLFNVEPLPSDEREVAREEGGGIGFASVYDSPGLAGCGGCHAPDAPGNVQGTEKTLDWTDVSTAYASLQGTASGLVGNFEACNGVPFIGDSVETSLIVAVFDEDIREDFSHPEFPDCTGDSIADMTLKTGGAFSEDDLAALKAWIDAGGSE